MRKPIQAPGILPDTPADTQMDTHNDSPAPGNEERHSPPAVVILVHAIGGPAPDADWCKGLADTGLPLFAHGIEGLGEQRQTVVAWSRD